MTEAHPATDEHPLLTISPIMHNVQVVEEEQSLHPYIRSEQDAHSAPLLMLTTV
jgi:hypothetical protein